MTSDNEIVNAAFQSVRNKAYAEGYNAGYAKALADAVENLSGLKPTANLPKPAATVSSIDESTGLTRNTSVGALGIDRRIQGRLVIAGICTIGDLLNQSRGDLLSVPGLGIQSLRTIRAELYQRDMHLRDDGDARSRPHLEEDQEEG
jgi:DNA-directed RNA polymerase alpha subunit